MIAILIFGFALSASAAEPAAKTVFELYCGNCSRSVEYRTSYPSIEEAIFAAGKASKTWGITKIKSTDLPNGYKSRYSPSHQVTYHLHLRSCKNSWSLHSSHTSLKNAMALAKQLRYTRPADYKIVPHYTQKVKAGAE